MALYGKTPKGYIRGAEAARRLRVSLTTVKAWVRSGRLKGRYRMQTPDGPLTIVKESSLAGAFKARCLHCDAVFETRRPERAKFCCRKHERALRIGKRAVPRPGNCK